MGEAGMPGFELQEATVADLDEIAIVHLKAMSWDPSVPEILKGMTFAEMCDTLKAISVGRLTIGTELGACKTWKVVELSTGKLVAWAGLGIPTEFTTEQRAAIRGNPKISENISEGTKRLLVFVEELETCLAKHGYDPAKHYMRQNTMVHPDYQRRGFGRMITRKFNQIADEAGVATFVRARHTSKPMFESEGFKVLERIKIDYESFDIQPMQGDPDLYCMKRDPHGK